MIEQLWSITWVKIALIAIGLIVLFDELGYAHWKHINPGWIWTAEWIKYKPRPLVQPPPFEQGAEIRRQRWIDQRKG